MTGHAAASVLVVGIGNVYRGDDAAGLMVASLVRSARQPGVTVLDLEGEPVSLLDLWAGTDAVYLADAVRSGGQPGTVYRFDAALGLPPAPLRHRGTHAFSLGDAIEMARAVGGLPGRLVVYGIEGAAFQAGVPLSAPVRSAVTEVACRILAELAGSPCRDGACITCSDQAMSVRVVELLDGDLALVDTESSAEIVSVALVDARVGDTVLVHAGEAIAVVPGPPPASPHAGRE
jgi:hydrogenase maturation protease